MATIFVAKSQSLQEWSRDVGLTKHVYKVGITEETAEEAIAAFNKTGYGGRSDWKLVKKQSIDAIDEGAVLDRLARKEKAVDPFYYPQIKGAKGIFKVKIANVERQMMVEKALAGADYKVTRVTPADIGTYLMRNAIA